MLGRHELVAPPGPWHAEGGTGSDVPLPKDRNFSPARAKPELYQGLPRD
jgi:hypothetical protein